jgi:hypothetical protein
MNSINTNELKFAKLHAVQELGHIVTGVALARCGPLNNCTQRANFTVFHTDAIISRWYT